MDKQLNIRINPELIKRVKKKSIDEDKKVYEVVEECLGNKIYLLLVVDDNRALDVKAYADKGIIKRMDIPIEWKLDTTDVKSVGIQTVGGFKRIEKDAEKWALERCKNAKMNEEVDFDVSDTIVPFEQFLYINHKCVLVEKPNHYEKSVKLKGFRREGLELPIFGYIELLETPDE
jgi:hypothetical protein